MDRLNRFMDKWIPVARVVHPYPMQRFAADRTVCGEHFAANYPRQEPYALIALIRIYGVAEQSASLPPQPHVSVRTVSPH